MPLSEGKEVESSRSLSPVRNGDLRGTEKEQASGLGLQGSATQSPPFYPGTHIVRSVNRGFPMLQL